MQWDTERLPQCKLIVFTSDTIPSECIHKILVSSFDCVYQDSWSLSLSLPASPFFFLHYPTHFLSPLSAMGRVTWWYGLEKELVNKVFFHFMSPKVFRKFERNG